MSIVGRYNPKLLFFPEKLLLKMNTIREEALTIVEAPLGYGKTTAVHHFMQESDISYIWVDVERKDNYHFFEMLCSAIKVADENVADELKAAGYPFDESSCDNAVNILKNVNCNDGIVLVFDNFQNVTDELITKMLVDTANIYNSKIHIVFITQSINTTTLSDLIYNQMDANYISKKEFEFSVDEIIEYYRKCGIKLNENEAVYLQKYTDGWISAIYLQLLYYIEKKSFEPDIGINYLIGEMFWDRLSVQCQDLLIRLGLFEQFTMRQAIMMSEDKLSEKEIKEMLSSIQLIHYDKTSRKYKIHGLLRFFLEEERENLEVIFQNDIYSQTGRWYAGNQEYEKAIHAFYRAGNYKAIYGMGFKISDLEGFINNDNKQMFINIIQDVDSEYKERFIDCQIVMCLVLYIYHEKDFFEQECKIVKEYLDKNTFMSPRKKERLNGEMNLLFALKEFNDLGKMKKYLEKASEYIKSPDENISSGFTWTFKTPSVLFNLLREDISSKKLLEEFEQTIPLYYKITGGKSKGAEALMRGEILLNQMDLDGAEVLCHKALYMSETREQIEIYAGALFLLARISIYKNDLDNLKYIAKTIRKKISETDNNDISITMDLAMSYLYILLGRYDKISPWLKYSNEIEKKCVIYNLIYANVLYGRYLIENNEYKVFAGISGTMLNAAGIYKNSLSKIYTYIYIAVGNYKYKNDMEKSVKFIKEAFALAKKDDIILPFVENYHLLEEIFNNNMFVKDEFANKIKNYSEIYELRNISMNDRGNGLTKREKEIAHLAAERFTNKEIALKLHISENTVKSNLKTVYSKLGISNRSELNGKV